VKSLVKSLADPSALFGSGIHLAGTKYMTIKADEGEIIGKKGVSTFLLCLTSHKEVGSSALGL